MSEFKEFFPNFRLGEPNIISNLIVFPVHGESYSEVTPITLDDSGDGIQIEELTKPAVGNINIRNLTDSEFFGGEGEELVGALQHRIFVTSFLLPGRSEKVVPVSCVEEGRWQGDRQFLSGSTIAYPSLRALTSQSIYQSLSKGRGFQVDQKSIWKEIERKQTTLKTHSQTRSIHDTFDQLKDEIAHFSEYTPYEDQVGFLALTNRRILCADIFLNPELFRKFMRKLLISYALDAIEDSSTPGSFNMENGKEFFSAIITVRKFKRFAGVALGEEWRFKERGVLGKALIHEQRIYHLSAFPLHP